MAYIQSLRVTKGQQVSIVSAQEHQKLPRDENCNNTDAAIANNDSPELYGKGSSLNARPALFLRTNDNDDNFVMEMEVRNIPSGFHGKSTTVEFCIAIDPRSKTHPEGVRLRRDGSLSSVPTSETHIFSWVWSNLSETPWGLCGIYNFIMSYKPEDGDHGDSKSDSNEDSYTQYIGVIPLEIYILPVQKLSSFFNNNGKIEVPLLLLRMFVIPQRWTSDFLKRPSWIKTVVDIAHGSREPLDGSDSDTRNHWLKYDSVYGSSSFTGMYGESGLNLQAWLDAYRNWKQNGITTDVNCYDQAAITEVALSLGIPYDQIHWEFHQLYGFIGTKDPNEAKLVGWGPCNSPYFAYNENLKVFQDVRDPQRTMFRNHAYLSWSTQPLSESQYKQYNDLMKDIPDHTNYSKQARKFEDDNNVKLYMIDACGGPHYGTETRQEYEDGIEAIGNPEGSYSAVVKKSYADDIEAGKEDNWGELHHLGAGITKSRADGIKYQLPVKLVEKYESTVEAIKGLLGNEGGDKDLETSEITQVQQLFRNYIADMATKLPWTKTYEASIRPYGTNDGIQVYETKIYYYWKTQEGNPAESEASMRLSIGTRDDKRSSVRQACAAHLAYVGLTNYTNTLIKDRGVISCQRTGTQMHIPGTYYRRVLAYGNAAIEIFMETDNVWEQDNTVLQNLLNKLAEFS